MALLAALALALVAGCTGGGRRQPAEAAVAGDVTAQAKQASATVVSMARIIRSWRLDSSVSDPLISELGYVDVALQQGNQLGARALLSAWMLNARKLTGVGVLSSGEEGQYQSVASRIKDEIPGPGRVTPFTQSGAPPVVQSEQEFKCGSPGYGLSIANMVNTYVPYALSAIPEVGSMIAGLYAMIWTGASGSLSKDQKLETWKCLREEAAKTMAKQYANFLDKVIEGLQANIWTYVQYVNHSTPEELKQADRHWRPAQAALNAAFPWFKGENQDTKKPEPYAYVYLPEFAQFMNLDLASLRDGVLNGEKIGLNSADIKVYKLYFTDPGNPYGGNIVVNAKDYADKTYDAGFATIPYASHDSKPPCPSKYYNACWYLARDRYNSRNAYPLYMIPAVKDQAYNWSYMDPVQHPGEETVPPNSRVIYSVAFGSGLKSFDDSTAACRSNPCYPTQDAGPIEPYSSVSHGYATGGPVARITVDASCRNSGSCPTSGAGTWVRAWQVTWGSDPGKEGPRYGFACDQAPICVPGRNPPLGTNIDIHPPGAMGSQDAPIVKVDGSANSGCDPVVESLKFTRGNEQRIAVGNVTAKDNFSVSFPGEVLADVYSAGDFTKVTKACDMGGKGSKAPSWNAPSSIVFGFRYADSYALPPEPPQPPSPPPTRTPYAAYITNHSTVSVVDTQTNRVANAINTGSAPSGVAVAPDGRHVYVTTGSTAGTVAVIDAADNKVVKPIDVGSSPTGAAVAPDGRHVYVANTRSGTVSVIDAATNNVVKTIDVGKHPQACQQGSCTLGGAISVTPDGRHVYVTAELPTESKVEVIDTADNKVVKTINVGRFPNGIAVTPDGRHVYVTTEQHGVEVIDAADNTVARTIDAGSSPFGVAVTPNGHDIYVANHGSGTVSMINTADNKVVKTIDVGSEPWGAAVTPNGQDVYVTNDRSRTVTVINAADGQVIHTISGTAQLPLVSPRSIAVSSRPAPVRG